MKAFAVIGYHHTGKTTVVTELIRSLSAKGYRVATIKDIHSEAYRADTEGKNSWKHIEAGAEMTFARGLYDSSLIFPKPMSLKEMTALLQCDYLIIEGMKDAPVPKVLCAENIEQLEELYDDTVIALSGKIASVVKNWQEPPIFDCRTEIEPLTKLVTDKVFELLPDSDPACCQVCGMTCYEMAGAILRGEKLRSDCQTDNPQQVKITLNGKPLTIVPFVQNLLRDMITAFLGNLKDAEPNADIKIEINKANGQD
jgi:molybdopterin-guanine dinucleotide biosynthesis protein B